jgi:hypothetical protein
VGEVQKLEASKFWGHNNKNFGARPHIKINIQPQPRGFIFYLLHNPLPPAAARCAVAARHATAARC